MRFVWTTGIAAALLLAAVPAFADPDAAHPWDATWVGGYEGGGDGVQLIVAGNEVIGFFYRGDYVEVSESKPLAADGSLSFKWDGGQATLGKNGDSRILTIRRAGGTDLQVIELTEDH